MSKIIAQSKRVICALLSGFMVVAIMPTPQAHVIAAAPSRTFADVDASAWYHDDVYAAVRQGIINGKSADQFAPDDDITFAEAITLAARYHQILQSGTVTLAPGNPWYEPYMDYAAEHFMGGADSFIWDGTIADQPITRGEFVDIFYIMLPGGEYIAVNGIDDGAIPDVGMSHRYADAIYAFYRAGILAGSDAIRSFLPDSLITRAEIAAVLARITNASPRVQFAMNNSAANAADSAAIWNNGGNYVKYGGDVYYRLYNAGSYETGGIWDYFDPIPGASSQIMRRRADFSVEALFNDNGHGPIYIVPGSDSSIPSRLVMNRRVNSISAVGNYPIVDYEVYSVALDGGGKLEYGKGRIFTVDAQKGLVFVEDNDKLAMIDIASGRRTNLDATVSEPIFYDPNSAVIYCEEYSEESDFYTIYAYDVINGAEKTLCEISKSTLYGKLDIDMMMEWYEYQSVSVEGGYLLVYLASFGGTGQFYYSSALLKIKADGSSYTFEENPREQDWFGLRKPFQWWYEGPFEAYNYGGDYFIFDIWTGKDGADAADAGAVAADAGVVGAAYMINVFSEEDMNIIGLESGAYFGDEDFVTMRDVEYLGDELWFTVHSGPRDLDEDIGWRYGYDREKSEVYMKDLRSGAIAQLYSY